MERAELTKTLLALKRGKNLKWEAIAEQVKCSPVWIASVVHGQNSMTNKTQAAALCEALGVHGNKDACIQELMTPPLKAQSDWEVKKQDPTIYRLNEVMLIYGESVAEIIHEKFGAGIMSAIDVTVHVDKESNDDGKEERVKVTISGKYLKFKEW